MYHNVQLTDLEQTQLNRLDPSGNKNDPTFVPERFLDRRVTDGVELVLVKWKVQCLLKLCRVFLQKKQRGNQLRNLRTKISLIYVRCYSTCCNVQANVLRISKDGVRSVADTVESPKKSASEPVLRLRKLTNGFFGLYSSNNCLQD